MGNVKVAIYERTQIRTPIRKVLWISFYTEKLFNYVLCERERLAWGSGGVNL
jgi:hypothetical protein